MGRSEVTCSFFFLCFLAQICTDRSQFPSGWVHSTELSGTIAVFTPDESGPMEMFTQRKITNAHQVFDKYSCYSNEKNNHVQVPQLWLACTMISVESMQVLARFGFGNRHPSGWCFSASQHKLSDLHAGVSSLRSMPSSLCSAGHETCLWVVQWALSYLLHIGQHLLCLLQNVGERSRERVLIHMGNQALKAKLFKALCTFQYSVTHLLHS